MVRRSRAPPGGGCVLAYPEPTDEYRATAERLGYGDDVLACSRDHELAHTRLSLAAGLPCSPVLEALGAGAPLSPEDSAREEEAVMAFQAWTRWLAGTR